MCEAAPWHDGLHHGAGKRFFHSFLWLNITTSFSAFTELSSVTGCRLIQNSEKLESHLPEPSNTLVVQLHPPRCREQETVNTSQASIMSPLTVLLPETASLTTDWRCINLTHTDANETNSAACLIHWEVSLYRETRATAVSFSISTALSASHLYGFLTQDGCRGTGTNHTQLCKVTLSPGETATGQLWLLGSISPLQMNSEENNSLKMKKKLLYRWVHCLCTKQTSPGWHPDLPLP